MKQKYLRKAVMLGLVLGFTTYSNVSLAAGYSVDGGTAYSEDSIAIGNGAETYEAPVGKLEEVGNIAIGRDAKIEGPSDITTSLSGIQYSGANCATAIGTGATIGDGATLAIGGMATAKGWDSIAIGRATTENEMNIAIGQNAKTTGSTSMAIGLNAESSGGSGVALGESTNASGALSSAIGSHSEASGDHAIAVGYEASASAEGSIATGIYADASENNAISIGPWAQAKNANSVALGAQSCTSAAHTGTTAQQVALGGITYNYAGLASDGSGTVSVGGQLQLGPGYIITTYRQIQNVAAGDVSETSTDAINGSQLYATNEQVKKNITDIQTNAVNISNLTDTVNAGWEADVNGTKVKSVTPSSNKLNYVAGKNMTITGSGDDITIATKDDVDFNSVKVGNVINISNVGIDAGNTKITNVQDGTVSADSKDAVNGSQLYSVKQDILNMGDSINGMGSRINSLDKRVDKVGAGAAALAALHPLDFDPDDKWDFAAGYGHYDGRNAYALGLFYRPNEDTMLSAGSTLGNGENLFNAGLSLKIGQGNHVSTTRVAMAKEMLDLRADNKAMHEQINALNNRLNSVLGMLDMAKSASFPDVPENHWAYEAVAKLAGNGVIKGYPDGTFQGDRTMTRYEFASMLYRAMEKGATIDGKLLKEFKPELDRIRVDTVSKNPKIQRVRVIPGRK